MNKIPKLLSKTKLMRGYRCLKCIYLTVHHPELESPITPETQALFDQGHRVNEKAREKFSGGILIDNKPWDFIGSLTKTRQLISEGQQLIYEAAFEYAGCYARVDILQYSPETKRYRIFEVKSSTKVKPEHYDDVGLQTWILAKSGLPIEQINILHLNPDCRYPDLENLFTQVDVTENIREKYLSVRPTVNKILTTIQQPEIPDVDIGSHCTTPNECGFKNYCWQEKKIPDFSIFNLPKMHTRKWELYADNIIHADDARLSELSELNELQQRIIQCFKTGERFVNHELIQTELSSWKFPLVFLDFETINPAIPRYENCKPFEQVPFQFSVHVLTSLNADIIHKEFLHDTNTDPRPTLIPALLEACEQQGSIVAYYGTFESERIKALADYSTSHAQELLKLIDRIVDPLPIIRENIYDNAFQGSFSLKKVAPALLGESHGYKDMLVADGNAAQRAYEELISPFTSLQKKLLLKQAMLEYCKKDTLVMVELVKWLYALIEV